MTKNTFMWGSLAFAACALFTSCSGGPNAQHPDPVYLGFTEQHNIFLDAQYSYFFAQPSADVAQWVAYARITSPISLKLETVLKDSNNPAHYPWGTSYNDGAVAVCHTLPSHQWVLFTWDFFDKDDNKLETNQQYVYVGDCNIYTRETPPPSP